MSRTDSDFVYFDYDPIAHEYARRLSDELDHKPLDKELLKHFATLVRDKGTVCDLGCGPGHIARFLADQGVSVFGLDLSSRMIEEARALNPALEFIEGDMRSMSLDAASLAGVTAFYSIVNIPPYSLHQVFEEIARVLRPTGSLILAFHIGSETVRVEELWGHPIVLDFFFFPVREISERLEKAGLLIDQVIERDPYPEVEHPSRRCYILAHKP